ncbi:MULTISPECIES: Rne/Rng family ribonuclease [unclassified Moraxella]|uniref:Rne/Rng family ribonuclease n=1 Tax=unclassified Moraxella TaxID=2685852 RepID=UPI00359DC8B3
MTKEILINHLPMQTRLAVVQDGVLDEIYIENHRQLGQVGDVYLGTVVRILTGMQAVFVDIGLARTAFLHIDDVKQSAQKSNFKIEQLFYQGERILVQIIKGGVGDKGVRLTTDIALVGRYLVYRPLGVGVGLSSRIKPQKERQRLKHVLSTLITQKGVMGGVVVRTAATKMDEDGLDGDLNRLYHLWQALSDGFTKAKTHKLKHQLIHQELPLPLRHLRDSSFDDLQIWVDDEQMYHSIQDFFLQIVPSGLSQLHRYAHHKPLFDKYDVEEQIQQALKSRVDLPLGGYLVIDQTEAMTTIDVNTGSYVGKHSPQQTIYQINLEAVWAIVRQIRLRQLGGIIILDFIDMKAQHHKDAVLSTLKHELSRDKTPTHIMSVSPLGLIEMARKRTHQSLAQQLCQPCEACCGTGMVKSNETVAFEIIRKIVQTIGCSAHKPIVIDILAAPVVIDHLAVHEKSMVQHLEHTLNAQIQLKVATNYHQEQYAISHH